MIKDKNQLFSNLFSQNEKQIYSFILSIHPFVDDVDDIMQETMAALWDKFDDYDPEQPFIKWACSFAYFKVKNHRKKVAIHQKHFKPETLEILEKVEVPENTNLEKKNMLESCMKKLKHDELELLKQRFQGHESIKDCAESLSLTPNSLYEKIQRIKSKLSLCVAKQIGLS